MAMKSRFILLNMLMRLLHIYADARVCRTRIAIQLACPLSSYGNQLSTNKLKSVVACSEMCSKNQACRAFLYNPGDEICLTFGGKLTTIHQSCTNPSIRYGEIIKSQCRNIWMFEPCSVDADCPVASNQCLDGKCQCDYGYPYDYRTDSCPTECVNYGKDLREVSIYLELHNTGKYTGYTMSQCLAKCFSVTSYVCRFIEYDGDRKHCLLSSYTARTAPGAVRFESNSLYWQWDRNCA